MKFLLFVEDFYFNFQELSASLDTYHPKSADLFRAPSATEKNDFYDNGKQFFSFASKVIFSRIFMIALFYNQN